MPSTGGSAASARGAEALASVSTGGSTMVARSVEEVASVSMAMWAATQSVQGVLRQ